MIFEVITVIVLGRHEPHSHKMANLILKCRGCSDWPATPHEGLKRPAILFRPSFSLRHNSIKIRPSKCSSESKRICLSLKSKTRNDSTCKEGMSKSKIGQKTGLFHLRSIHFYSPAKLWMQRKTSWRKLKVLLQWKHEW